MKIKFRKLRGGSGVEWLIIFTALSMLFSVMICINYYYVIRSEARKLAINISNSIVLDEKYKRKFSGINSKEDFIEIFNLLNILYEQYGNSFTKYVKKISFFDNFNLIIPKINKLCLLLNDNKFYAVNNNELEEVKGNFLNFYRNHKSLTRDIMLYSNIGEFKAFFLPTFTKLVMEKVLNKDFNDKELFDKFDNKERKVIDESKTKRVINILLENYNKNKTMNAFKGFNIEFLDSNIKIKETNERSKNSNEERVSFFFYSYLNKNKGVKELNTLNYKIRSINDKNNNNNNRFYHHYPNSLHLVIYCNFYIPFINIKSFEMRYSIDICIEQKELE